MQICHFSHEHPLTLCMMDDPGEPCNGCSRPISDLSYVCHDCGFLLHKKCAKLPRKVLHRLHSKHALILNFIPSETFMCSECKKTSSGLAFQCSECNYKYNLDVTCFVTKQPYPDAPPLEGQTRKLTCCCKECDLLTLQKSCAQLSRQREHPLHHSHSFTLCKEMRATCDACRKITSGFVNHCDKCSCDLDSVCTCLTPSLKQEKCNDLPTCCEESHGQVSCNSCGTSCSSNLYRCVSCNFDAPSTCLPLPSTVKHRHHCHSLTLEESTPKEDSSGICCAACEKKISPKALAYYCAECCYGIHLECVVPEDQPDLGKLLKDMARVQDEVDVIATQLKPCPRRPQCSCH
ncbi:hypothetical protein BT93_D1554 [Corymbia citriodora subsp. variegata]|nr:hypothetical protein BT93_D1554 [Corymbia citriodora subsp. variegata]